MRRIMALLFGITLVTVSPVLLLAETPANHSFAATWQRTDKPVADGQATRTWMWGPEAFTGALLEPYQQSPDGQRVVQYFDKARMEITRPGDDPGSIWYVTNGLLVVELMSGRVQTGDDDFVQRDPAQVNVAGDADDPDGISYALLAGFRDAPPAAGEPCSPGSTPRANSRPTTLSASGRLTPVRSTRSPTTASPNPSGSS